MREKSEKVNESKTFWAFCENELYSLLLRFWLTNKILDGSQAICQVVNISIWPVLNRHYYHEVEPEFQLIVLISFDCLLQVINEHLLMNGIAEHLEERQGLQVVVLFSLEINLGNLPAFRFHNWGFHFELQMDRLGSTHVVFSDPKGYYEERWSICLLLSLLVEQFLEPCSNDLIKYLCLESEAHQAVSYGDDFLEVFAVHFGDERDNVLKQSRDDRVKCRVQQLAEADGLRLLKKFYGAVFCWFHLSLQRWIDHRAQCRVQYFKEVVDQLNIACMIRRGTVWREWLLVAGWAIDEHLRVLGWALLGGSLLLWKSQGAGTYRWLQWHFKLLLLARVLLGWNQVFNS